VATQVPAAGGVLNILKPIGPTSHDIVNRLRRALGVRRIGHSGTLDPMAEGVLLVGVGPATRLLEYLNVLPKRYVAGIRFGQTSDTQDATGAVTVQADTGALTAEQVEAALDCFRGEIEQVPPMYSAIKIEGTPLYDRARRGEVIERAARRVTVYELSLKGFELGPSAEATLGVRCSSGTYVRTLCHDLGAVLGTGAVMTRLVRTAIGPFGVESAVSPDGLARLVEAGDRLPWAEPADAVAHLPDIGVPALLADTLRQGKRVALSKVAAASLVRVLDERGHLVAIARAVPDEAFGVRGAPAERVQAFGTNAAEDASAGCSNSDPNAERRTPASLLVPIKVFPPADADY
jgi:tRNA pseudouridine55 synthase